MMNKPAGILLSLLANAIAVGCFAQSQMAPQDTEVWDPEPKYVSTVASKAPSDAIVLFDGNGFQHWVRSKDGKSVPGWLQEGNYITVVKGQGDIQTKQSFGDCQLHIEWRTPTVIEGDGQWRGNSGIFMQGLYEIQILDSYENRTYANGQAASLYKQIAPLVNTTKPPGEWQSYDIVWTAPVFAEDGRVISKARLTLFHNGVVVQNNVELEGPTLYIGKPAYHSHGPRPLLIQDHDNPVSFRNIWIRPL